MAATGKKPKTPADLERLAALLTHRADILEAVAEKMKSEGVKSKPIAGEPMFESGLKEDDGFMHNCKRESGMLRYASGYRDHRIADGERRSKSLARETVNRSKA